MSAELMEVAAAELSNNSVQVQLLDDSIIKMHLKNLVLHPMKKCHCLVELDLRGLQIQDINSIESYKNIMYLDISQNLIYDISILTYLPYLIKLNASNNSLTSCLPYNNVKYDNNDENRVSLLSKVDLSNNKISGILNMKYHPFIEELNLSNNKIHSTIGFSSLSHLKVLDLSNNQIIILERFDSLPLTHLNLRGNKVKSLAGLQYLSNLTVLDISDNQIEDLTMLRSNKSLIQLHCDNNQIGKSMETSDSPNTDKDILDEYLNCLCDLVSLRQLSLVGNPIQTHIKTYREQVIFKFPKLLIFDGVNITAEEKVLGALSLDKGAEMGWI